MKEKICNYCGKKNKEAGHHCSGKEAYKKGYEDAMYIKNLKPIENE